MSVCLSHAGMKRLHESSSFWHTFSLDLFFATQSRTALCFKEIRYFEKIRGIVSGTLSQTLDLEKFRHTAAVR